MPVEVLVPALGESVVEATVGNWLKAVGDTVAAAEPIVELETDKVNVEVGAPEAGVLQRIDRKTGDVVNIGDVIAVISNAAVAPSSPDPVEPPARDASRNGGGAKPMPASDAPPVTPVARRLAAENDVDLSELAGTGPNGRITKDDVAGIIEKRAAEAASPAPRPEPALAFTAAEPVHVPEPPPARAPEPTRPAPPSPSRPQIPTAVIAAAAPAAKREDRIRMSRRRLTIATRLVEAQRNAAMLTTFNEVDMTAIMDVRKRRKDSFKERNGVGLGFMSFFTKASVGALKAFPQLNAEIQGEEILIKHYYDIGIAVGVEEGLVVPVVRDADRLSFAEIERRIGYLAGKARDGKLTLAELQGGTFTITNGGVFGSLMSTPILNAPQVAILGMHKIQERPVVVNGEVTVRPMMYLALSYDHRIVDGSEAVRFLVRIKELAEDPESLLLEG
ncbi:MAG: 2-oxoglutarate dehydrogenase complex dihydrolipoyllysine-residue succinyltransferase [Capsulimonadaceae bacterium]